MNLMVILWSHCYCKFTIIRENFIFAINIREFDRSRIQHSRRTLVYIQFTYENVMCHEF